MQVQVLRWGWEAEYQLTLTVQLEKVGVADIFLPNDCIKNFDNAVTTAICVVSLMVKPQSSKLMTRVRFPYCASLLMIDYCFSCKRDSLVSPDHTHTVTGTVKVPTQLK